LRGFWLIGVPLALAAALSLRELWETR